VAILEAHGARNSEGCADGKPGLAADIGRAKLVGAGLVGVACLRLVLFAAACLVAASAAAQTTIQQDFASAEAALAAGDLAGARARIEALLGRLKNPDSRAAGLVKARLGAALAQDGEPEAAIPLLDEALRILSADTAEDRSERVMLLVDRASAREALGLFGAAATDWRAAMAEAGDKPDASTDVMLRAGLSRALIWSDPAAARTEIDALLARMPQTAETKDQRALVTLLRGRVELNAGDPKAAIGHFNAAAKLAGGTGSTRINRADMQVRGDLAIAHHLLRDIEAQQRLVAYSGAGGLVSEGLSNAAGMPLPPCGAATGLAPDDVAVIEFWIGDDGRVRTAVPIYAARGDGRRDTADGGPATQFVQAVRQWYWRPADAAKIEPFWRQAVRVELRCSNARPEFDLVRDSFTDARSAALVRMGMAAPSVSGSTNAARLQPLKDELLRRTLAHGADSRELAGPLMALARNDAATTAERIGWMERSIRLLEAAGAPPEVLTVDRVELAQLRAMDSSRTMSTLRDALGPILAAEQVARPDARTTNYVRLTLAEVQHELGARKQAEAQLQRISATPMEQLGRADPIRTAALLRLSNIAAARKDLDAAASALAATGLSPEQCAPVDVRPRAENKRVGEIFPAEAARWRSGGLTRVEYDIATNGKAANVRTVVSSPPFVFGEASERGARQFRFEPVFRPGNETGCVGAQQGFRFTG
jgi:tetratricopeptide (TPR) repeat protein